MHRSILSRFLRHLRTAAVRTLPGLIRSASENHHPKTAEGEYFQDVFGERGRGTFQVPFRNPPKSPALPASPLRKVLPFGNTPFSALYRAGGPPAWEGAGPRGYRVVFLIWGKRKDCTPDGAAAFFIWSVVLWIVLPGSQSPFYYPEKPHLTERSILHSRSQRL